MALGSGSANDIQIKVTVDSAGAVKAVEVLGDVLTKTGQRAETASAGFTKFQANLISLKQGLDLVRDYAGKALVPLQALMSALDRADKVEDVSRAFNSLQQSVGRNAASAFETLARSTDGLLTKMDLMKVANQAVILGVDKGGKAFQEMASAAVKLGESMGVEGVDAVEALTRGLASQQERALKLIGVQVDAKQANEAYARSIGTTVENLTEAQKEAAFTAAVYADLTEKTRALASAETTAGGEAEKLSNVWQDTKDAFVTGLSSSKELANSLSILRGILVANQEAAYALGRAIADLPASLLAKGLTGVSSLSGGVEASGFWGTLSQLTQGGSGIANLAAIGAYNSALSTMQRSVGGVITSMLSLNKVEQANVDTTGEVTDAQKELAKAYQETLQAIQRATGSGGYDDLVGKIQNVKIALADEMINAEEANRLLSEMADEAIAASGIDGLARFTSALGDANKEMPKAISYEEQLIKELDKAADTADAAAQSFSSMAAALNIPPELADAFNEVMRSIFTQFGFTNEFLGGPAGAAFISALTGGVDAAAKMIKGGQSGKEIVSQLTEIWTWVETAAGAWIAGPEGAAITYAVMKPITAIVNSIAGSILDAFNSQDPQSQFREGVGEWFEEQLGEGLMLVVDGAARKVTDFLTDAYQTGLEGLDSSTWAGFEGIGQAMGELFRGQEGFFEGFSEQLAGMLAGNLEDLNNLQIMLQATGLSAEQLEQAITKAYLDGNMTAQEFLRASQQIQEVYTQGIPGAVGAVDEAFQHLVEGGAASGRIAMDALGDIAAEAAEKGITSFEELRQALIDSGKSVEDVDRLFQALAQAGITDLNGLLGISVEQTAAVVAALESLGFGFEESADQAENAKEQMEAIDEIKLDSPTEGARRLASALQEVAAQARDAAAAINEVEGQEAAASSATAAAAAAGGTGAPEIAQAVMAAARMNGIFRRAVRRPGDEATDRQQQRYEYQTDFLSRLDELVRGSQAFQDVLTKLGANQLTAAEAGRQLNDVYRENAKALREFDAAEKAYNKALRNMKRYTEQEFADIARRYEEASDALEAEAPRSPEEQISELVAQYRAGTISAEEAASRIGSIQAGIGQGLPGAGDISGAMAQLLSGDPNAIMAFFKNFAIEGKEAGLSLGAALDKLRETSPDVAEALTRVFATQKINDWNALLQQTDAGVISLINNLGGLLQQVQAVSAVAAGDTVNAMTAPPPRVTLGVGSRRRRRSQTAA